MNIFTNCKIDLFILIVGILFFGCMTPAYLITAVITSPVILSHPFDSIKIVSFEYSDGEVWKLYQAKVTCDHNPSYSFRSMIWENETKSFPDQFVFNVSNSKYISFDNHFCHSNDFPPVYEIHYNKEEPNKSKVESIFKNENAECQMTTLNSPRIRNWEISEFNQETSYHFNELEHDLKFSIEARSVKIFSPDDLIWKSSIGLSEYLKNQTSVVTSHKYRKDTNSKWSESFFDKDHWLHKKEGVTYYLTFSDIWELDNIQKEPFLKLYLKEHQSRFRFQSIEYGYPDKELFIPEFNKIYIVNHASICLLLHYTPYR